MTEKTSPATRALRVLVIEDRADLVAPAIASLGHQAVTVSSANALAEVNKTAFDALFFNLARDTEAGHLIESLRVSSPWAQIFTTSDSPVNELSDDSVHALNRPVTSTQLRFALQRVSDTQTLAQRPRAQDVIADSDFAIDFSTESATLRRAIEVAHRAADGLAPVLIQGEPGVGKRALGRAIHAWSNRARLPLGLMGCRAPSRNYLESDWFGIRRPGPGGISSEQTGRVAAADGGTLLIEEVDLLPLMAQPKLLRLIERGEYELCGEFVPRKANVRIVATTSVDLKRRVDEGTFNSELLDALGTITLTLPPLRHRPQDTVMLAQRYLAYFARQTRRHVVGFSHGATDALRRHSWPGNARELRGLVERSVLMARNELIETSDFPQGALNRVNAAALGDPLPLERIEELHIRGVLAAAPSMEAAAATLGIDSVTLWRRRKRYGI